MKIKEIILNNRILYNILRDVLDTYGYYKLKILIRKYQKNPNEFKANLLRKGDYVLIKKGKYNYQTFSAFYLNNMLGLMLECMMKGSLPIIDYTTGIKGDKSNNWSDFFSQPFVEKFSCGDIREFEKKNNIYKPAFKYIYNENKVKLWGYIYNEFILFNESTNQYINNEYESIIKGKRVLGVICRGTDYTNTKPKYHPIQPDIDRVLCEAERLMSVHNYEYIYLATEDAIFFNIFREKFGDIVLTNTREYYDEEYKKLGENALLFSVNLGRDNEQYKKGLEYLSSILLLSKCNALIGGHCGGSDMAIYFNNCEYEYVNIYDCGVY